MAGTTFVDGQTVVNAAWLNTVNNAVYNGIFPSLNIQSPLTLLAPASGTALTVNAASGAFAAVFSGAGGSSATMNLFAQTGQTASLYISGNANTSANSLYMSQDSAGISYIRNLGNSLYVGAGALNAMSFNTAGNVTIYSPTSNNSLTVNAASGAVSVSAVGNQASSFTGLQLSNTNAAGGSIIYLYANNGALSGFLELNTFGSYNLGVAGNNGINLYTNSSIRQTISGAGNITINAPTSGTALQINGVAGQSGVDVSVTGGNAILSATTNTSGNTQLQLNNNGNQGWKITGNRSSNNLEFGTSGVMLFLSGSTGGVTINAPTSGTTMTINQVTGGGSVVINSTAEQFPTAAITMNPSTNASSRRVSMALDQWSFNQDTNGNGTKDFGLYNSAIPKFVILCGATSGVSLYGAADNSSAPAGYVGEIVNSGVAATTVSLTSGTPANATSITLTAGDWELSGGFVVQPAATTSMTFIGGGPSTTSATLPSGYLSSRISYAAFVPGVNIIGFAWPTQRFSLASTTTIYCVVQANFTVSTCTGGGYIQARRLR